METEKIVADLKKTKVNKNTIIIALAIGFIASSTFAICLGHSRNGDWGRERGYGNSYEYGKHNRGCGGMMGRYQGDARYFDNNANSNYGRMRNYGNAPVSQNQKSTGQTGALPTAGTPNKVQ